MAHYIFLVNVRTDDTNIDAPSARDITNEIASNLGFDAPRFGIEHVTVREIPNGAGMTVLPCGHATVTPCSCGWET